MQTAPTCQVGDDFVPLGRREMCVFTSVTGVVLVAWGFFGSLELW